MLSGRRTNGPCAAGKAHATPFWGEMLSRAPWREVPSNIWRRPGAEAANARGRSARSAIKIGSARLTFINRKETVVQRQGKERAGGGERGSELAIPTAVDV